MCVYTHTQTYTNTHAYTCIQAAGRAALAVRAHELGAQTTQPAVSRTARAALQQVSVTSVKRALIKSKRVLNFT